MLEVDHFVKLNSELVQKKGQLSLSQKSPRCGSSLAVMFLNWCNTIADPVLQSKVPYGVSCRLMIRGTGPRRRDGQDRFGRIHPSEDVERQVRVGGHDRRAS